VKKQTIKVPKQTGIAICVALLVVIAWIGLRWNAPPLQNCQQWLESYSRCQHAWRVSDNRNKDSALRSRKQCCGLGGQRSVAQLHGLALVAGQNPARIAADYGSYHVATPSNTESFCLREGTEYRIEVWGRSSVLTKKSASFHFGN
jgi:hypothetical protein